MSIYFRSKIGRRGDSGQREDLKFGCDICLQRFVYYDPGLWCCSIETVEPLRGRGYWEIILLRSISITFLTGLKKCLGGICLLVVGGDIMQPEGWGNILAGIQGS